MRLETGLATKASMPVQLDLNDLLKPVKRKRGETEPAAIRFAKYLKPIANGCIIWIGGIDPGSMGYGRFHPDNKTTDYSHRYAWKQEHGPIPPGLIVRHSCNNPACCNVKHMKLGTYADNAADMVAAGRQRGTLKKEQVQLIVKLHQERGHTVKQLSDSFSVSQVAIRNLLAGKTWAKVTQIQYEPAKPHGRKKELANGKLAA